MDRNQIIKCIDDYASASGLKPSTICQYAVKNRFAYDRLVSGSLSMRTAEDIIEWMTANPVSSEGAA